MKFKNLVLILLIISGPLSVKANENEIDSQVETLSDCEYSDETVNSEEAEINDKDSSYKNIIIQRIKSSVDSASVIFLFSVMGAIADLKEFSKKHSTLVAILSAAATYKLVKNRLN